MPCKNVETTSKSGPYAPISLNPNKKITIMSDGFMVDSQPSEVSLLVKQNLNPILTGLNKIFPPVSLNSSRN